MSSSLLRPACFVRLTWMVCKKGGRWPYNIFRGMLLVQSNTWNSCVVNTDFFPL